MARVKSSQGYQSKASAAMQMREDHRLGHSCRSECGGGGWDPEVFRAEEQ